MNFQSWSIDLNGLIPDDGKFHHVCAWLDEPVGSETIYVDGELVLERAIVEATPCE